MVQIPDVAFPRFVNLRQEFPASPAVDVAAELARRWPFDDLKPGARIAVAVGSRGITRIDEVVRAVVQKLKSQGAAPFIVPAMGSHGGGTAEEQAGLLAGYGVTEAAVGAPVRPSMDVTLLGETAEGIPAHIATEAYRSDGILLINRIKPHTEFHGPVESGLLKMIAVGLGKLAGAGSFHIASARMGFLPVVTSLARLKLAKAPFLGGVGLIEDQRHELARLEIARASEIEAAEPSWLAEAKRLMPRLPYDEIDLLIVDRFGKNISGAGMDPNVIGRDSFGYTTKLAPGAERRSPHVHRLFVRELTPDSHGNASGLGLADFTTARVVRAMDRDVTYVNSLTSLAVMSCKTPIYFETDREVLAHALKSVALPDTRRARVVRMRDTLSLEELEVSEACLAEPTVAAEGVRLHVEGAPHDWRFDADGNLPPLAASTAAQR
jgi:hypothetical protein